MTRAQGILPLTPSWYGDMPASKADRRRLVKVSPDATRRRRDLRSPGFACGVMLAAGEADDPRLPVKRAILRMVMGS